MELRIKNFSVVGVSMLMVVLSILLHFSGFSQNDYVKTVVIDAGHGGKDSGALGSKHKEKDITLGIALKTGEYIKKYLPDVKVLYTRKTDKFVKLRERAQIANDAHADLFISIHCDAFSNKKTHGSSTYVMGLHKSAANLKVAKKENAAILFEDDYQDNYDGFDPNSLEGYIALAMSQAGFRDHSIEFAKNVQDQMRERVGRKDRSVKEAGFLVLYMTSMPGVLIETGFITNTNEEAFLASKKGQTYVASAIYRAVKSYKKQVEKANATGIFPNKKKKNHKVGKDAENTYSGNESSGNKADNHDFVGPKHTSGTETSESYDEIPSQYIPINDEVVFAVQIKTHTQPIKVTDLRFKGRKDVFRYQHNGIYKYACGRTTSYSDALRLMRTLRKTDFKDAFIIALQNNNRISVAKAKKLLKK